MYPDTALEAQRRRRHSRGIEGQQVELQCPAALLVFE